VFLSILLCLLDGNNRLCTKELKNESSTLNSKAYQNPSILKPSIKYSADKMMQAFITNKNIPNVSMVTGKVNTIKSGLTVASKMASITATITEVKILSISIPGRILARIKAFTEVIRIFRINFI